MATLSQLPSVVDLAFVAGDTFRIRVRILDPVLGEPVVDFSEHTMAAEIAQSYAGTNTVAVFDVDYTTEAANSAVILTLTPHDTEGLLLSSAGSSEFSGVWDLEVTFPNGDVRTVAKGTVRCVDHITNNPVTP